MIEQLVKKAQKGNKKAFSQLIEFIKIDSYKLAYTYLKNEADSKDALCNAIEKAYKHMTKIKDRKAFKSWFLTITVNECKMIIRKNNQLEVVQLDRKTEEIISIEQSHESRIEDQVDIEKALDNLSEHTRSLIMLKYYQQYTFAEISQIFNLSESTVKSQTYKGLQDMKSNLEVKEGNYAK